MRYHVLLILIILLVLHCTPGVVPKTSKIEVLYLGSVYDDIHLENPVCASHSDLPGVRVAHTLTEPPFLEYYMYRVGLAELLSALEIDFIITDTVIRNQNFFSIPKNAGYAITNFEGIRFAMFAASSESLTIEDQVQLTLARERSDILWVIDRQQLDTKPALINFYINNRALSDTSISPLAPLIDTTRYRLVKDFTRKVDAVLDRNIHLGGRIDEHLCSRIASNHAVNVILYPENLFVKTLQADSMSLRELFDCINFEMKFKKSKMTEDALSEMRVSSNLMMWGNIETKNEVLFPDASDGQHIYDYYSTEE